MTARRLSNANHFLYMIRPEARALDIANELDAKVAQAKGIAEALASMTPSRTMRSVMRAGHSRMLWTLCRASLKLNATHAHVKQSK